MYEDVGRVCEELGLASYLPATKTGPIWHPTVTPREVYVTNHDQIVTTAVAIASVYPPSVEAGMEMAIAAHHGAEVLLVYRRGTARAAEWPWGIRPWSTLSPTRSGRRLWHSCV